MMRLFLTLSLAFALSVSPTEARIWVVAPDGSGDFKRIQDAIDAAVDGDTVLVRPGTYDEEVSIDGKAVSLVGGGAERTRLLNRIQFLNIPKGSIATAGHLDIRSPHPPLFTRWVDGNVILSDVFLTRAPQQSHTTGLLVWETAFIAASRVTVKDDELPGLKPVGASGVLLRDVGVGCLSQIKANGIDGEPAEWAHDGGIGGSCVRVWEDSEAYIAEVTGSAGKGGTAWVGGIYCELSRPAGRGGHGVDVEDGSSALIVGRDPLTVQGGEGGLGGPLLDCGRPTLPGGRGGNGMASRNSSSTTYSGVANYVGGEGGFGNPPGRDGDDIGAAVRVLDYLLPSLTVAGSGAIGTNIDLHLEGTPHRSVLLVISNHLDKIDIQAMDGFPLFAVPGGSLFLVLSVGNCDEDGRLDVSIPIPDIFDLVGVPILSQMIVLPKEAGERPMLSNLAVEVVTDR